jgi:hypothetical protein
MSTMKKHQAAAARHQIGLTIQYESQGSADVAALMESIRQWRMTASVDDEEVEARAGTSQSIYRARLLCRDAAAVVRRMKAALSLETAIRRVSMRIEYGTGVSASRAMVNLVA